MHHAHISSALSENSDHDRHVITRIHQCYAPTLDLVECEILDALLQNAPAESIATTTQLHLDTVRRTIKHIEDFFGVTSSQQLVDNCNAREWSSVIHIKKER